MGHNYHMPDQVRAELQRLPQCMAVFYYRDGEYQFLLCTDHFCQVLDLNREAAEEYSMRIQMNSFIRTTFPPCAASWWNWSATPA